MPIRLSSQAQPLPIAQDGCGAHLPLSRDSRLALLPTLPPRHGLVESIRLTDCFACVTQLQTVLTLCLLLLSMSGLVNSNKTAHLRQRSPGGLGRPLLHRCRSSATLAFATYRPQGRKASVQVVLLQVVGCTPSCFKLSVARCPLHCRYFPPVTSSSHPRATLNAKFWAPCITESCSASAQDHAYGLHFLRSRCLR